MCFFTPVAPPNQRYECLLAFPGADRRQDSRFLYTYRPFGAEEIAVENRSNNVRGGAQGPRPTNHL